MTKENSKFKKSNDVDRFEDTSSSLCALIIYTYTCNRKHARECWTKTDKNSRFRHAVLLRRVQLRTSVKALFRVLFFSIINYNIILYRILLSDMLIMTTSMDDDDKYADFNCGKSCRTQQVLYWKFLVHTRAGIHFSRLCSSPLNQRRRVLRVLRGLGIQRY